MTKQETVCLCHAMCMYISFIIKLKMSLTLISPSNENKQACHCVSCNPAQFIFIPALKFTVMFILRRT